METIQRCSICIRDCEIGKSFCQRRDHKGHLYDENRFCVIVVDYLFDKPIIHFARNSKILSIGSWGCNLRCLGCQNVDLSWSVSGDGLGYFEMNSGEIVDLAIENGCEGICYTYNEPAILLETVEKIASMAKEKGLFNVFVTNSTLTEKSTCRVAPYIDAVAADIKSLNSNFYYEYCGTKGIPDVANKILHCIRTFADAGCHLEVRTNIIPGANDHEENYHRIASWIKANLGIDTPWHLTRFFPANRLAHVSQTPASSILKAQRIGLDEGLKYVYSYLSKGCDCANEKHLADLDSINGILATKTCCKQIVSGKT